MARNGKTNTNPTGSGEQLVANRLTPNCWSGSNLKVKIATLNWWLRSLRVGGLIIITECLPLTLSGKTFWTQHWVLFPTGVVTSPGFPGKYPSDLNTRETIQVEEGLVVYLHFDAFEIQGSDNCKFDYLRIMDSDGTTLMDKKCGFELPNDILSTSNIVNLEFVTNSYIANSGWNVRWSAVTPGECHQQYVWIILDHFPNSSFLRKRYMFVNQIKTLFRFLRFRIKSLYQVQCALPTPLPLLANPAISYLKLWTATTGT